MPPAPPRPCRKPGCPGLCFDGSGYCKAHRSEGLEQQRKARQRQDQDRGTAAQRGYGGEWRKAREGFLKANPLCAECQRKGRVTAATVVDHIVPHRGDMGLFWDRGNWQPLCKPCHDRKTARGE